MSWFLRVASYLAATSKKKADPTRQGARSGQKRARPARAEKPTAIACSSPELMNRVCDRVDGARNVDADGFRLAIGKADNKSCVSFRSNQGPLLPRYVRAIWAGHRPGLMIFLVTGTSDQYESGELVVATSVVSRDSTFQIETKIPHIKGIHAGAVGDGEQENTAARCDGLHDLLSACADLSLPALVLLRVVDSNSPPRPSSGLVRNAGRIFGKIAKRSGGMSRWWSEHQAEADSMERQIDLAWKFLSS